MLRVASVPGRVLAALLLVVTAFAALTMAAPPSYANSPAQSGQQQVTLNPGGGILETGSDGIRFTLNTDAPMEWYPSGQDEVYFRNQDQYCCSAGAPSLAIGTYSVGQAGALYGANRYWTSIEIVETSGAATVGARTSQTGSGRAVVRYEAVVNSLRYVMERTVTYTYPNNFVTDQYTFTIPQGNTVPVKFYLGGDTAPGGSDQGLGVMLTQPVRTVFSVNPSSGIQFGFREVPGSKPFDGATSQNYGVPYAAVAYGGNIGFYAQPGPNPHDAGLMVQWNLGSTPGVQTAALQQSASAQGTNLVAGFDRVFATPDETVSLDASIENTLNAPATPLGFTVALPAGVRVVSGARSNTCGGTLTAVDGATSVTVSGASVAAQANCVVSVPVAAADFGTYTLSSAAVTTTGSLTNSVGTSSFFVPLAPSITTDSLGEVRVGQAVDVQIAADGAPDPTYAVTAGTLPAGLTLDAESGQITGTPTAAGTYSFTVRATNSGGTDDQVFSGSVLRGTPGLSGSASPSAVSFGAAVDLTAADLPAGATGVLSFAHDGDQLCTVTLPGLTCETVDDLLPGSYPVTLSYSGDANWAPRSEQVTSFTVSAATTEVSGSLSRSSTTFRSPVTVTAEVTPATDGTVTVLAGERELCTITLPATSCETPATLPVGEYSVSLAYSGAAPRYLPSVGLVGTLVVDRATPNPAPDAVTSTYGERATWTLPGLPDDATGTVTFTRGETELCSYPLGATPESCQSPADVPAGEHTVEADYSGDDSYEPVQRQIDWIVSPASTSISTPATLSSTYGEAVTVPATGLPSGIEGTVEFRIGTEVICSVEAAPATDCALPADLAAGEHDVLVSYSGDDNHHGSDDITSVTVARAAVTLAVEDTRTGRNQPVRIEVGGLPEAATGTVSILRADAGVECSFDVSETDGCETTGTIPPGTWPLTAVYSGDGNHLGDEQEFTLEVDRDETSIVLAETVSGVFGEPTLLAVALESAEATGEVRITRELDGDAVELCTVSVPEADGCSLPADLSAGEHVLTATYAGDANFEPATATTALTVARATSVLVVPESLEVLEGEDTELAFSGLAATATGTVEVRLGALPAETAGRAAPAAGDLLCSVEVPGADSCSLGGDLPVGEHQLSVRYAGDANHATAQAEVPLKVLAPDAEPAPEETEPDPEVTEPAPEETGPGAGGGGSGGESGGGSDGQLPQVGASTATTLALLVGLLLAASGSLLVWRNRPRRVRVR